MGEKVTRKEAMAMLGHDPHNRASITEHIRAGRLTVFPGVKRDPRGKGRRQVQYFDVDEIDALLKQRAEAREKAATATGRLLGPHGRLAGSVPDPKRQEEVKLAREEFLRETVNDAQARALLGASAWELMQLATNGQIRTRRMMGEERYERADVMAEQARRDAKKRG